MFISIGMVINKMEKINKKKSVCLISIFTGLIVSVIISIFSFFILTVILANTSINENIIPVNIIIISCISILIGGFICSRKKSKNGIINGGLVGMIYIAIIYFLSSIILNGFELNIYSILMIVGVIFCGMFGGVIGVNHNKT